MFMFQGQKVGHMLQILTAGIAGEGTAALLQVPSTHDIITAIQVGAQVLIAIVTCVGVIRKTFQKPVVVPVKAAEGV